MIVLEDCTFVACAAGERLVAVGTEQRRREQHGICSLDAGQHAHERIVIAPLVERRAEALAHEPRDRRPLALADVEAIATGDIPKSQEHFPVVRAVPFGDMQPQRH